MSAKKHRDIPADAIPDEWKHWLTDGFRRISKVSVNDTLVSLARTQVSSKDGPKFTDEEIEYLIAKIRLAKQQACDHADMIVTMLRATLDK